MFTRQFDEASKSLTVTGDRASLWYKKGVTNQLYSVLPMHFGCSSISYSCVCVSLVVAVTNQFDLAQLLFTKNTVLKSVACACLVIL